MRFNATLNVDFAKWSQVKMERENNLKEYKGMEDEQPKYFCCNVKKKIFLNVFVNNAILW